MRKILVFLGCLIIIASTTSLLNDEKDLHILEKRAADALTSRKNTSRKKNVLKKGKKKQSKKFSKKLRKFKKNSKRSKKNPKNSKPRRIQRNKKKHKTSSKINSRKLSKSNLVRSVDNKCFAQSILAMRRWKDVVSNFIRQDKRIKGYKKTGEKKSSKKYLFSPIADKLLGIGGGNKSALSCGGTSNSEVAKNMTILFTELESCEKNINDACNPENFPKLNATMKECVDLTEIFVAEANKCMLLSLKEDEAEDGCDCWKKMTQLTEEVNKCKLKDDLENARKQQKSCTEAFGKCRKLEDAAVDSIYACATDGAYQCTYCQGGPDGCTESMPYCTGSKIRNV